MFNFKKFHGREIEFYTENESTDFHVYVTEIGDNLSVISVSNCGRGRGDLWSKPEESIFSGGFYEIASKCIKKFGGFENIWSSRIGQRESW